MRLRKPPVLIETNVPDISNGLPSVTYEVTTITPIFGGGVEAGVPDAEMPIRATAIRGQLRYWWRFLASHREENPIADLKKMFEQERSIWGGMGEKDKDYSGKVFVRVFEIQNKEIETYDEQQAEYALFPARSEKIKKIPAKELIREGIRFKLKITAPAAEFQEIEEAIRWWMTFGGIGSRTRRGLGSIKIEEIISSDITKVLESVTASEAEKHKCKLVFGKKESSNPTAAWEEAIKYLKYFRQEPEPNGLGRNKGHGRSHWPEPDSIRRILNTHSTKKGITRFNKKENKEYLYQCNDHSPKHPAMISFPRAYFGLPIVFQFKDVDCGEPGETQLLPKDHERLASPLILTPYRISNGKYVPAALRLPFSHIDNIQLRLTQGNNNVPNMPQGLPSLEQVEWENNNWPSNWWHSSKAQHVKPINNNNNDNGEVTNPLEAFMNYFSEKK